MALTSPKSHAGSESTLVRPTLIEAAPIQRAPATAPVAALQDEPDDGVQTARDLVIKNLMVFGSAGFVIALAVWLLA